MICTKRPVENFARSEGAENSVGSTSGLEKNGALQRGHGEQLLPIADHAGHAGLSLHSGVSIFEFIA